MNVTAQKFQSQNGPSGKSLARSNHRTTLPQSRPFGRASSLREGAGNGLYHSSSRPKTATFRAIFIAPTKARKILVFTIQRTTLPQSRPFGRDSSLREGAGNEPYHSSYRPKTATFRAIFIAPTKGGFHSSNDTPSVTPFGRDSSLREGAGKGCVPFNVPPKNRNFSGDFHRPYEKTIRPRFPPQKRYRVGQGTYRMGTR